MLRFQLLAYLSRENYKFSDFLNFEDGTDRISRNAGKEPQI